MPFQKDYSHFHIRGFDRCIRNALDTWQLAWNARSDVTFIQNMETAPVIEPWTRIGFFQHADEWRRYTLGVLMKLNDKLREHDNRRANITEPATVTPFEKSDETSMDQVASLLKNLQFSGLESGDEYGPTGYV